MQGNRAPLTYVVGGIGCSSARATSVGAASLSCHHSIQPLQDVHRDKNLALSAKLKSFERQCILHATSTACLQACTCPESKALCVKQAPGKHHHRCHQAGCILDSVRSVAGTYRVVLLQVLQKAGAYL